MDLASKCAICLNRGSSKCLRCFDASLFKTKGEKKARFVQETTSTEKARSADNSWEDLEQSFADSINNVPSIKEARRSRRSGALWFEKGDIVDEILHPECKERTGKELKSGMHSMSIQREWLEKAKEECQYTQKTMCLPFRFKEDENTYCIFDAKDIAELVTTMKAYMYDNDKKEIEIQALNEQIKILKEKLDS